MSGDIMLRGSGEITNRLEGAQPPARVIRRTKNALANISADLVVSGAKLEAGAVLGTMAMTHLGTMTAVAEAVVEMHPAAAQGCGLVLNAYAMGASETIRRTVR